MRRPIQTSGSGPWASVSECNRPNGRKPILVFRYDTKAEAESAKAGIDRYGCGGFCSRQHHVAKSAEVKS